MPPQSFYGSSEYSPEAEELFARYVRGLEAGAEPDFDAFCEEHEEWMDELYGLHTDWDNVRGLVAKLGVLGAGASEPAQPTPASENQERLEPAPQPEAELDADEPALSIEEGEQDAPDGATEDAPGDAPDSPAPARRSNPFVTALAVVGVLAAGGLGAWVWNLDRTNEVMAQEQRELLAQEAETRRALEASREAELALTRRGEELTQELTSTSEKVVVLEGRTETLASERDEERLRAESARVAAELAASNAAQLAALVPLDGLLLRESLLWPTAPDQRDALAAWIDEAAAATSQLEALELDLDALPVTPQRRARFEEQLAAWTASGPGASDLLEFTRLRLERLEAWSERLAGEDAELWRAALAAGAPSTPATAEARVGYVPLRVHPVTELWLLADAQTGAVPVRDDEGNWLASEDSALLFTLVPSGEVEGRDVAPFLLALESPSEEHLAFALGPHATSDSGDARAAWPRLGYRVPTADQRALAERAGLSLGAGDLPPARSLD